MNLSRSICVAALVLALSPAAAAGAGKDPGLIPMPRPPAGPAIERVTHSAASPVDPGSTISVLVRTEPGVEVSVRLGPGGAPVSCPAVPAETGSYRCSVPLPPGLKGSHHVVAESRDGQGRTSRLSSILPVVIGPGRSWESVNTLNARLRPVFFEPGSAMLDGTAIAAITANLKVLDTHDGFAVLIEGHCDSAETADHANLARERAGAVADRLASMGLSRDRLIISGQSDSMPLLRDGDEQARALNRRVMILFHAGEESADR